MQSAPDNRSVWLLAVPLGAAIAYLSVTWIDYVRLDHYVELHRAVLEGKIDSPYQYRVLVPFLTEWIGMALMKFFRTGYEYAFVGSYFIVRSLFAAFSIAAVFSFLRRWFPAWTALSGSLLFALLIWFCMKDFGRQTWSLLEPGLICTGLLAFLGRRWFIYISCILIGSLNKETILLLPLMGLALAWLDPEASRDSRLKKGAVAGILLYAALYLTLRWLRPEAEHIHSFAERWAHNLQGRQLAKTAFHWLAILGPAWWLVVRGFRSAPDALRSLWPVLLIYLALMFYYAKWYEIRLLLSVCPILIAYLLSAWETQSER